MPGGLRDHVKDKALFLFTKQMNTDFVFFSKSHTQKLVTLLFGTHDGAMIFGCLMVQIILQESC